MNHWECYFENMLFVGEDPKNRFYLTDKEAAIIETCVDYIIHKLFDDREDFVKAIDYYDAMSTNWGWE